MLEVEAGHNAIASLKLKKSLLLCTVALKN
jgi:hypothetical protein